MQKQSVKLVKSQNGDQQYHILIQKKVGEGAFGAVYEARDTKNPKDRLVVKIMKIDNDEKRNAIDRELKIMSEIPLNLNIVRVIPLKMYSTNYYYIFMEYCEGTLSELVQNKRREGVEFKEQEIYDLFYQCMRGYKGLYDKKILHQDIKPANILIKKGVYKLADFGFGLFYEGHDFGQKREGTFPYIAPQKLAYLKYVGNHKSDIYSFGVMFYELIAGHHPYLDGMQKGNYRNMIQYLCAAKLKLPSNSVRGKYSLRFDNFFDMIILMVKKVESSRVSFDEICEMIQTSDLFQESRRRQKEQSKQFFCQEYDFIITEFTNIITLPADVSAQEQEECRIKFDKMAEDKGNLMIEKGKEIANYFIQSRLIVYYLDRLARKLIVEKLKMQEKSGLYDRIILYLMLLIKSLLIGLVNQLRCPKNFDLESYICFKRTHQLAHQIISLLQNDHKYIQDCLQEILQQSGSLPKKEEREILQLFKQKKESQLVINLIESLNELLRNKTSMIQYSNKPHLVTLANIISILEILQNFPRALAEVEKLEVADKKVMTSTIPELIGFIETSCSNKGLICGFDMTGAYEDDDCIAFEAGEDSEDEQSRPVIL